MQNKLAVIIIDPDPHFRLAVRRQLNTMTDAELVGEAENVTGGAELLNKTGADLAIMELPNKPEKSLALAERWRAEFPDLMLYASSASKNPDLILSAMRAGISEYLGKPLEDAEFRRAIEKAVRLRQSGAQRGGRTGQVAAVFSKKGGLGVTTIAVNLATALSAEEATRAVIVDMSFDLGDVASFLDLRPEYTVADLLDKGGNVDAGKLQSCLNRHPSGLYYFGERESTNEAEPITPSHVRQIIAHLRDSFSHVIIDLPHTFDTLTYEAFEMADVVLLVATADMSTLRATKYSLRVFRTLGYDERKVEIVLNRVSKKDAISVAQFERTVEQAVAWQIPNSYKQIIESINVGEPMVTMDRKSNISKSLTRLAERFAIGDNGSGRPNNQTGINVAD